MEAFAEERDDLYLRKIDVRDHRSQVFKQHKLAHVPHLVLFENGYRTKSGTQQVLDDL